MMAKRYIFMLSMRLFFELSEATSSSSSLEIAPTSRHTEVPKTFSVNHLTSTTCVGTCACKCFRFLSSFICMSPHPHCICLFALRATKHFPVRFGQSLQLVILSSQRWFGVGNFQSEQTGTTWLFRIECLLQQPKQTESHHSAWNLLKAARFSVLKWDYFLRHAVWPP